MEKIGKRNCTKPKGKKGMMTKSNIHRQTEISCEISVGFCSEKETLLFCYFVIEELSQNNT